MSRRRLRPALWTALAAGLLLAAPSRVGAVEAADPLLDHAVVLPCPPARIDAGDPTWRFALADGFFGDEREGGRSFAWTGRRAAVLLAFGDRAPAGLTLTVRGAAEGRRLVAALDGRDLGARPVPLQWTELAWELPPGLDAPGLHRLELRASDAAPVPPDHRELGVAVDRLDLKGVPGCAAAPRRARPTVGEGTEPEGSPVELPPGGFLVARPLLPPGAAAGVRAAPEPAASDLRLFALAADERAGPLPAEARLGVCCRGPFALALYNAGAAPAAVSAWTLRGTEGDRGFGRGWSRACGLVPWEAAGLGLLLVAGFLLLRFAHRLPGRRHAPWLDALLVVAAAFALRALFLHLYPEVGRAGDTYEYVLRARRLAAGELPFLSSTGWHAWQTWLRPPGFYLFLAGVFGPLGGGLPSVLWWNAALSSLAAGATYLAAYALFGRGAALAAGLLFAGYLEAVVTVSRILSEPLYMALLMPGLALLAAASRRPAWGLAGGAGALLGAAALVRSAPVAFVPLAALLLLAVHGPRRGWRGALALGFGAALLIVPWSARNSLVRGTPTGIDDLAVINLLQVQPDARFVPHEDLDLDSEAGARIYYSRLQRANADARLARQGGAVLARNLRHKLRHPAETLTTIGHNLGVYFSPYGHVFFLSIHDEPDRCRVALLTDAMNLQYLVLLALAAWGLATRLRDRRTWPLALWPVLNVAVLVVLFHAETKYRLPVLPVLMVFAGAAVSDLARRLGRRAAP